MVMVMMLLRLLPVRLQLRAPNLLMSLLDDLGVTPLLAAAAAADPAAVPAVSLPHHVVSSSYAHLQERRCILRVFGHQVWELLSRKHGL